MNLKEIKCLHYNIKHISKHFLILNTLGGMKIYMLLYQSLFHTAIKEISLISGWKQKSCVNHCNYIKYHVYNVYFWQAFTCSTDSTSGT